ncbi:Ni/Fe hydrogenase 1 b-type cytochrome subunit [Methylacidiphilum kamchatkense Kam1]|uniref:Ni/Fe hydrogenase 1 b-type cytochrome subunit n=2 Tax=Methylacidiphilum kamchatkense Kam1 TaxID=1202785 RepID=A0ABR4ZZC3_9BACT|nr:Ni/Fe-hydrogenase, b-type cytochrome subunit [Methylacidiphilum kamchatkense]KIE59449.1 Ni/Fe hydrogenase 1 b-type cytochrome subunit [Methylacidiphilum kamchatkense Kam1]
MKPMKEKTLKTKQVYVYEAPLRLWHWINAASIFVLSLSGYFIAHPPPSIGGEAFGHYNFAFIRYVHFVAALLFDVGLMIRIYWALAGNRFGRDFLLLPLFDRCWWTEVLKKIKWYLFLEKEPIKYVGADPLNRLATFCVFLLDWFMLITGLALFGEMDGMGTWAYYLFTIWVLPIFGSSQNLHTFHHLGMWLFVIFILLHVYVVIREDILGRVSVIETMINGWRTFRDDRP